MTFSTLLSVEAQVHPGIYRKIKYNPNSGKAWLRIVSENNLRNIPGIAFRGCESGWTERETYSFFPLKNQHADIIEKYYTTGIFDYFSIENQTREYSKLSSEERKEKQRTMWKERYLSKKKLEKEKGPVYGRFPDEKLRKLKYTLKDGIYDCIISRGGKKVYFMGTRDQENKFVPLPDYEESFKEFFL